MRRSKTFLLDQVKMKKWPSSIIHKGLPENQYYHSELQGNISFPSKEQVYRKLMALLDNGKKLLLDRLKLLLLLASQQKPQQPFAQERVTPGRKKNACLESMHECCRFPLQHTTYLYCKSWQHKVCRKSLTLFAHDMLDMWQKPLLSWALVSVISVYQDDMIWYDMMCATEIS